MRPFKDSIKAGDNGREPFPTVSCVIHSGCDVTFGISRDSESCDNRSDERNTNG